MHYCILYIQFCFTFNLTLTSCLDQTGEGLIWSSTEYYNKEETNIKSQFNCTIKEDILI